MNINRIKVLGLLALPLLAIAMAVMVFAVGHSSDTAEATDPGPVMGLRVEPTIDCDSPSEGKVCVQENTKFEVIAVAEVLPPDGIIFAGSWLDYGKTGLESKDIPSLLWLENLDFPGGFPFAIIDPGCSAGLFLTVTDVDNNGTAAGCVTGSDPAVPNSPVQVVDYKGNVPFDLYSFSLTCNDNVGLESGESASHKIELLPATVTNTSGSLYTEFGTAKQYIPELESITINCAVPPPATDTPTATETFTPTPTATPPPIPRMQKCNQADNDEDGLKDSKVITIDPETQEEISTAVCDNLINVFLTRQGAKIPVSSCFDTKGTTANVAELGEKLNQVIVSPDPKDPTEFQQLAAFEFEVHYDNTKVCVDINVGEAFEAAGAVCIIQDGQPDSKPQLEGVARIGCVTIGKGHGIDELVRLATIDIYPQPEIYTGMKPNQDNGNVVQINNVNCDLGDEQGHAIPIFSCDDVDITFRYLEGDVEPDCVVDAIDAQAIAFRWGVEKGSLIYKDFMNLEPSSQQQDNDIDINDLQFVFGRFGSTCKAPHPDQDPVNAKA